jgi:hypothetical protein
LNDPLTDFDFASFLNTDDGNNVFDAGGFFTSDQGLEAGSGEV